MQSYVARLSAAAMLSAAVTLYAAEKPKPKPAAPVQVDPYAEVQPATENLDLERCISGYAMRD